ncbi:antibiotic biosynthesis monooxygenase [Kamptonema animale CS-326]|jgi:quinol monooxygenase YgiN/oxalate decarboxylase/phosphoglucose isomerase-like protein (cupin superfamily)|uniref:antibiotic biosynthesis monooxygenase n=1 Tax=Kamptonema animale TaxID=92934 RepID=UPI00232AF54D|nr:antibiotic biosynthesis monooxygenase [Kamptonema animale]MDB9510045.1 antibiotic biosynthesis monooxygenase [Kamptonema animale CS-326]
MLEIEQNDTRTASHLGHDHTEEDTQDTSTTTAQLPTGFTWPSFSKEDRYNPNAPYNGAPQFQWSKNIGLPIPKNFSFDNVLKEPNGDPNGENLSFYTGLQQETSPGSNQWDSFPAGEAQQFLISSVSKAAVQALNSQTQEGKPVNLNTIPTSTNPRPYTMALTVTPYNAGPIPHIHWAEDEWFIVLQGEMDAWLPVANKAPYQIGEIPGQNGVPKIDDYYYVHLTSGQIGFLPAGYTHNYRNASPTKEPLTFLTIWSRKDQTATPGGIEEFFAKQGIGVFADTANDAAGIGSLYNKNPGSPEFLANQQRFRDYFKQFPDYYVALSQNFGSYLTGGGNWNPSIPEDTQIIPSPPPNPPFLPPGPNSPSTSVNFNIPLDPALIERFSISAGGANSQQLLSLVSNYEKNTRLQNGNSSSDFYRDQKNPQNFLLIERWNKYSDLDKYRQSDSYKQFVDQLKSIGAVVNTPTIDTVETDSKVDSPKVLVGKFKAKSGTRDQIISLANELTQKTKETEKSNNVAFEFYEDTVQPNQYFFYEKYVNGAALDAHLGAQYTEEFFRKFSPLLEGKGLSDTSVAQVKIESVRTSSASDPLTGVYQGQKDGVDILTNLFKDTPELSVSLNASNGIVSVNNKSNTPGVGINLLFAAGKPSNQPVEYGVFAVDDANNRVNGLLPTDSGYLKAVQKRAMVLFNTTANSSTSAANNSRNIPVETTQKLAIYQVAGGSIFDANPAAKFSFQDPQFSVQPSGDALSFRFSDNSGGTIALNGPVESFQDIIGDRQTKGRNVLDTSTIVDRQIEADIDITKSPQPTGFTYRIGLYEVLNKKGDVKDLLTGEIVTAENPNYANVVLSKLKKIELDTSPLNQGQLNNSGSYLLDSGKLYAPYMTTFDSQQRSSATYFAYKEANPDHSSHIISLGANRFGLEDSPSGVVKGDFNDITISMNFNFADPPFAL